MKKLGLLEVVQDLNYMSCTSSSKPLKNNRGKLSRSRRRDAAAGRAQPRFAAVILGVWDFWRGFARARGIGRRLKFSTKFGSHIANQILLGIYAVENSHPVFHTQLT